MLVSDISPSTRMDPALPAGDAPPAVATKRYLLGTHRTCAPEETLARVRPLLPAFGITRVANLTGLDHIGVPVVMACRPNARSVTISQGKGLTLAAAKASAIMEAAEVWHAERILNPLKLASCDEMRTGHRMADTARLPRKRNGSFTPATPLLWIEGRDLMGGGALWLPYELVSANYTLPLPAGSGCFQPNTNGLASGNHWLEAVNHALCEVVERDSRTLWQCWWPVRERRVIDPDSVDDPGCREVLAQIAGAGLQVRIWDITTDVGIAAFACALLEGDANEVDPELGSGCHPARHVALLRALTEACQARLTYISGARDDYFPEMYSAGSRKRRRLEFGPQLDPGVRRRAFSDVPTFASSSLEEDHRWILARLRAAGVEQAAAVDLTREDIGVPVARVIVPGLEGALDDNYSPGPRARRYLGGIA